MPRTFLVRYRYQNVCVTVPRPMLSPSLWIFDLKRGLRTIFPPDKQPSSWDPYCYETLTPADYLFYPVIINSFVHLRDRTAPDKFAMGSGNFWHGFRRTWINHKASPFRATEATFIPEWVRMISGYLFRCRSCKGWANWTNLYSDSLKNMSPAALITKRDRTQMAI